MFRVRNELVCLIFLVLTVVSCAPEQPLESGSRDDYLQQRFSQWIFLPEGAGQITTHALLERDFNFRAVRCTLPSEAPSLEALIRESIGGSQRTENESFVVAVVRNLEFDFFEQYFGRGVESFPEWMLADYSRFDQVVFGGWEDHGYGYGYLYMQDRSSNEMLVFQWSQQHGSMERAIRVFGDADIKPEIMPDP